MSVSSEGARASGPGPRPPGPKGAFAGQIAWVLGADTSLGRSIAVELAGRGAEVWVVGADERKLGEAVGEIAYQGGWGRHLVMAGSVWGEGEGVLLPRLAAPAPHLIVAAAPERAARSAAALARVVASLSPVVAAGGALLLALTGTPDADVGSWLRPAARLAARGDRALLLNVLALASVDADGDGAARVAALVCSADASGLTGQLVVVASA